MRTVIRDKFESFVFLFCSLRIELIASHFEVQNIDEHEKMTVFSTNRRTLFASSLYRFFSSCEQMKKKKKRSNEKPQKKKSKHISLELITIFAFRSHSFTSLSLSLSSTIATAATVAHSVYHINNVYVFFVVFFLLSFFHSFVCQSANCARATVCKIWAWGEVLSEATTEKQSESFSQFFIDFKTIFDARIKTMSSTWEKQRAKWI